MITALVGKNVTNGKKSAGNQRFVTTNSVGSSETIRKLVLSRQFCEWLAGVIDGDGSLQLSQSGYTSLEITTGLEDLPLLEFIKHKLGGSCRLRSGVKAYRYRLHNREGMVNLVKSINGYIRHSIRVRQLHMVCSSLNLTCIESCPLTKDSNWFAGFFDADGTIHINFNGEYPRVTVAVTNKYRCDVESFANIFGGNINFDKAQNGYFSWSLQSRETVLNFYNQYVKQHPFRSRKAKRFYLLDDFYSLRDLKAYKSDSSQHKAWLYFMRKWDFEEEHQR